MTIGLSLLADTAAAGADELPEEDEAEDDDEPEESLLLPEEPLPLDIITITTIIAITITAMIAERSEYSSEVHAQPQLLYP